MNMSREISPDDHNKHLDLDPDEFDEPENVVNVTRTLLGLIKELERIDIRILNISPEEVDAFNAEHPGFSADAMIEAIREQGGLAEAQLKEHQEFIECINAIGFFLMDKIAMAKVTEPVPVEVLELNLLEQKFFGSRYAFLLKTRLSIIAQAAKLVVNTLQDAIETKE